MSRDLHFLTVAEGSHLLSRKAISPVEWTRALLDRIDRLNPAVRAFVRVVPESALAAARAAEDAIVHGHRLGPLHGVPFAAKDIFDTAGLATTGGSRICAGRVPDADSSAVRRLREAGAVLLGKLTTHEFAYGGPSFDLPDPPARNPWDLRRFTGGSSSGSGAAVAAGLAPATLGSDTGGSIRHPAAHCGIAGLKPSAGLVSRVGVLPLSFGFDTCGPMAWTAEDCAHLLQALAGFDPADPQSAERPVADYLTPLARGIDGMRLGLVRHFHEVDKQVDPRIGAAIDAAVAVLKGLGATVEEVKVSSLADFAAVQWVITCAEANAIHEAKLRERRGDYGENFRYRILPGAAIGAVDYVQAQRQRRTLIEEIERVLGRLDALLTATVPVIAPPIDGVTLSSALAARGITGVFNVTAGPALALCCGFTEDGVPLSMTVAGRPFDDATVLRIGHAYEKATPWRDRRPTLDNVAAPPIKPTRETPPPIPVEQAGEINDLLRWADLRLDDRERAQFGEAFPHADTMIKRLRRDLLRWTETATALDARSEGKPR